jgi:hypothetical protein
MRAPTRRSSRRSTRTSLATNIGRICVALVVERRHLGAVERKSKMTPTEKKIAIGGVGVLVVGGVIYALTRPAAAAGGGTTTNLPPLPTSPPVVAPGANPTQQPQTAVVPNTPLSINAPALTDPVSDPVLILMAQTALQNIASTVGLPFGILFPSIPSPGVVDNQTLQALNAFRQLFGWGQVNSLDYQTLAGLIALYASRVPGANALPMVTDVGLVTMAQTALARWLAANPNATRTSYGLADVDGDASNSRFKAALQAFQQLAANVPSMLTDGRLDWTTWGVLIMTSIH